MKREWGNPNSIGGVYKVAADELGRVGNCWMKGRLREGDLVLCLEHSGDCFYDFALLEDYCGQLRSTGAIFGAYAFAHKVKQLKADKLEKITAVANAMLK